MSTFFAQRSSVENYLLFGNPAFEQMVSDKLINRALTQQDE